MSSEGITFFAYGSALDDADFKRWLTINKFRNVKRKEISPGWLVDHKLQFHYNSEKRKGGIADVVPQAGFAVPGVLFQLEEQHQEALDVHEGAPDIFEKHEVTVCTPELALVKAITYKLKEELRGEHVRPDKTYEGIVKKALEQRNLPTDVLFDAGTKFLDKPTISHVFVYGTTQRRQRDNRVMQTPQKAKSIDKGKIKGELYDLGNFPGLCPGQKWVKGEIYHYDKEYSGNLQELDSIIGSDEHGSFKRVVTEVKIAASGKTVWAWTHILLPGEFEATRTLITHGDWLQYLMKGRR
mmetsp:Transcript_1652/g.2370  ORF Transcript_1652/g.2370 Transcript_1652/m.2370 type:complete len:297 (+) Transcript_1652:159-1049(+)